MSGDVYLLRKAGARLKRSCFAFLEILADFSMFDSGTIKMMIFKLRGERCGNIEVGCVFVFC